MLFHALPMSALRKIDDVETVMARIASQISKSLRYSGVEKLSQLNDAFASMPEMSRPGVRARTLLHSVAGALEKDIIVFFDGADKLSKMPMITFLAQLREGCRMRYDNINAKFSRSLALVGMKNIADRSGDGGVVNIVKESFLLPNF